MRLGEGQKATDFKAKDIFDDKITLENYKGKKLLLSFYRYASCQLCNLGALFFIAKVQIYKLLNKKKIKTYYLR